MKNVRECRVRGGVKKCARCTHGKQGCIWGVGEMGKSGGGKATKRKVEIVVESEDEEEEEDRRPPRKVAKSKFLFSFFLSPMILLTIVWSQKISQEARGMRRQDCQYCGRRRRWGREGR